MYICIGYNRCIMIEKEKIKRIIGENQAFVTGIKFVRREIEFSDKINYVLVGLRRAGKSYLMYQQINKLVEEGHSPEEIMYFNFEDDRLGNITQDDLDTIKTCYEEMFNRQPIFFFDEIQNVDGWELFARRLADHKYRVYITGSNAKMLSSEIAGRLGGRFMIQRVQPYSFREYLSACNITVEKNWLYTPRRNDVVRLFDGYFRFGGLPEVQPIETNLKRSWLNNLYNKIFFGDILARYSIRNNNAIRLVIRKLAESVRQPSSLTRIANIVSSAGSKVRVETIADYLTYAEESCLIIPIENYAAKIVDKVSNKKYYFIDNGILNLFLFDPETSLLENLVAVNLFRIYEDVCFYNNGFEVDFYIWEHKMAIQVAYSLADESTRKREVEGLLKLSARYEIDRMLIITHDEHETIDADGKIIEVLPAWRWLMEI